MIISWAFIVATQLSVSELPKVHLHTGQQLEFSLTAPANTRSIGRSARGSGNPALFRTNKFSDTVPFIWNEDLSVGAENLHIASLHHCYLDTGINEISLILNGPCDFTDLTVVWVSASNSMSASSLNQSRGNYAKPNVFPRADWSADAPQCPPSYCSTTHVGVHHTASSSEFNSPNWSQCAANVKATQQYHMYTRGWCDIGYNYLICVHGDIFEGREGGDDVRGAHDGFNCGSMGVSMMGYFHSPYNQIPSVAMMNALTELTAWKCDQQSIAPNASSYYSGYLGQMQNIFGHRDVKSTSCPGDLLFPLLPQLRDDVDALIGSSTIIMDNSLAFTTGSWSLGTMSTDKYGADYLWSNVAPNGGSFAWWAPVIPVTGDWEISMWWPEGSNRSASTMLGLKQVGQLHTVTKNQQINGGQWNVLGSLRLPAGSTPLIGISNQSSTGSVVVADAIRLVKRG